MEPTGYQYSGKATRNPFRLALAAWRVLRNPNNPYRDVASAYEIRITEIGFARSRLGRRFGRWHEVAEVMRADPQMAERLQRRAIFGPIDLDALVRLPEGSVGRVFAEHCRKQRLNPNMTYIQPA